MYIYKQLYNGILRGFGNCGEVKEGVEFASDTFWALINSVTVADRIAKSNNKFASTIHVLASAIKKLQVFEGLFCRIYVSFVGLFCKKLQVFDSQYGVATSSRLLKIIGVFCRIYVSFVGLF